MVKFAITANVMKHDLLPMQMQIGQVTISVGDLLPDT